MKVTYSAAADALSVQLLPAARTARSEALGPDITADFDDRGRLIALEVLQASHHYPAAALAALAAPVDWLTLAQAAKESGLSTSTLRVQLNAGRLAGKKQGRDWLVARHELWSYLESRDVRGRPAAKRKARRRPTATA